MDKKIDVIVIGAGPAGIASAITIARGGKSVVVLERGRHAGSKNMFGGAIYLKSIQNLFPDSWQSAPLERLTISHSWAFLTEDSSVSIGYKNPTNKPSASVFRPKFDDWMMNEAKKAGVYFAPSTTVRNLIIKNEKVVGVRTDLEEFYASLTILADGVNSILREQLNLGKNFDKNDVILGVKEILKMPKEVIEDRFNLKRDSNEGAIFEYFGGLDEEDEDSNGILSLGFIYTFKNSIAIGLGASLDDLAEKQIKPYELLDNFKEHPQIKNYIQGGETLEYSAHLIPEWGFNKLPKIYAKGVLLTGDCAGFTNSIHFEGTNLAMKSGVFAGETALLALEKADFGLKTLSKYEEKIKSSFIYDDLKSYRNVINLAKSRKKSIFKFYPQFATEFFEAFTSADEIPKKIGYRKTIKNFFFKRKFSELLRDCYEFAKTFFEVIK